MSLAREALRIATVRALRGATWVGDRVRDSEQGAPDDNAADKAQPEIIVYTDDAKFGRNRGLFAGGVVNLVIEIVITARMQVRVQGSDAEETIWDCPQTDAAMELTLGMIERQVKVALSDPRNTWTQIWQRFALEVGDSASQRGTSMRDGIRFAGRQLVLPITVPSDPTPGVAPGPLWTEFLAIVDQDEDLAPAAAMLRLMIEGTPSGWPGWEVLRYGYGLSGPEARAMGIMPPVPAAPESPEFAETVDQINVVELP